MLRAELIVTVQAVASPLQSPPHPVYLAPDPGFTVRVTAVPAGYALVQVSPHRIPSGLLRTRPGPIRDIARVWVRVIARSW
jgi:hypothetical protein